MDIDLTSEPSALPPPSARTPAPERPTAATTLIDVLTHWATLDPERPAFTYFAGGVEKSLSFGALRRQALAVAGTLRRHDLSGARILLACPLGLDFVVGFFACLYSGNIAVPVPPGRSKGMKARLSAIIGDCEPRALLTTKSDELAPHPTNAADPAAELIRVYADAADTHTELPCRLASPEPEALAFLQYTSGSTAEPKGTAITHANILANQRMLQELYGTSERTVVVSWLPLFHDMGLIGMVLHGAFLGARVVLVPTLAVLKEPLSWLRAVGRFRGTFGAAPNFAFDLCVQKTTAEERRELDLSSWEVLVNGSEPVQGATVERFIRAFACAGFRPSSLAPSYGLAEATLVVSGSVGRAPRFLEVDAKRLQADQIAPARGAERAQRLVGCGRFDLGDQRLKIVAPHSLTSCLPGEIGEIWLAGSHVASGYFRNQAASEERFDARLPGDEHRYLRTGDLGFVLDGELFVTGRIKDLIIVRGQKLYPQDIENTVEEASPCVRRGSVAAFGVDVGEQQEVVVVAEVERREQAGPELVSLLVEEIRGAHDLSLRHVLLVAKGNVPRTTSGKIQRQRCRRAYLDGRLTAYAEWSAPEPAPAGGPLLEERIETYAREWLHGRLRLAAAAIEPDSSFGSLGLDSIVRVELFQAIELRFSASIPDAVAYGLDSIRELARHVASAPGGSARASVQEPARNETSSDDTSPGAVVLPAFSALAWDRER